MINASQLSSPQIGIAPTWRSRSLRAASVSVSSTETHSASPAASGPLTETLQ